MRGRTWARRTATSAVAGLLAELAGAMPAAAAPELEPFSDLSLSAAAVQPYRQYDDSATDHPLVSLGFSGVVLRGDPACMATGAGYWLGDETERYPVMKNSMPQRRKIKNSTAANVVRPQPASSEHFNWTDASPSLAPGLRVAASCADDGHAGRAGATLSESTGPRLAGSATTAVIDRAGTYDGTARSFVQDPGLTTGGTVSAVTSLLHIRWPAGAPEPTVTYRLTLTRARAAATRAAADPATVTLAGTQVPVHQLAAQFAEQHQALAGPLASLAEVHITGPAVSTTGEDPYHSGEDAFLITAPSVVVRSVFGPTTRAAGRPFSYEPRQPSLTSENGLRLGAASLTAHRGRPRST